GQGPMARFTFRSGVSRGLPVAVLVWGTAALAAPAAHADNKRLNSAVVSAVYTLQHQAGCTNDVIRNNALTLAAIGIRKLVVQGTRAFPAGLTLVWWGLA